MVSSVANPIPGARDVLHDFGLAGEGAISSQFLFSFYVHALSLRTGDFSGGTLAGGLAVLPIVNLPNVSATARQDWPLSTAATTRALRSRE